MSMYLDGVLYKKMLINGLSNLINYESQINELNVFPVPDGDTGTNMRLTLENGVNNMIDDSDLSIALKSLSRGMLLGARGNSGVILSQLFRGQSKYLKDNEKIDAITYANALEAGYKLAYDTVINPTEGTILTVAREGIRKIKNEINQDTSIEFLLEKLISQMEIELDNTPNLLKVLKDAGVKDSGGYGLIIIYKGMYEYLKGNIITRIDSNINRYFKKGYVVTEKKNIAVIAVSPGDGISDLFRELGVSVIINGGDTLNTSTEEFINALESINANNYIILPNNKNILLSALLAKKMQNKDNIYVIETKSVVEGYFALQMANVLDPDITIEECIESMNEAINGFTNISLTKAIRDAKIDDITIAKGEYISLLNGKIVKKSLNKIDLLLDTINMVDMSEKVVMTIIKGFNVSDEEINYLEEKLNELYPDLEIGIIDGKQELYDFFLGIN